MATAGSRSPLTIPTVERIFNISGINSIGALLGALHNHQTRTHSFGVSDQIRPGEEARRAYPPSYSMREPRRGLSLHSIHLLSFDVTLISRRDQSQARRC